MALTPIQRFYNKVEWGSTSFDGTPCLLWTASCYPEGYGQFWDGERRILAHKFHWEFWFGPMPERDEDDKRLVLDHYCHSPDANCPGGSECIHRPCVNLHHIGPESHRVNVLRGVSPSAKLMRLGECAQGHRMTTDNTYQLKGGGRRCKTCQTGYRQKSLDRRVGS